VADMQQDLAELGVSYDNWFTESSLTATALPQTIELLKRSGHTYQQNDALWFRSSNFQDDKDRVLIRSNGQPTYFANDVAYHLTKFSRGFTTALDIVGADHHGYIPRVKAAMQACAIAIKRLTFIELQNVSLYRGTTKITMSTRHGNFVTLRELRQEVGNDAARFFYINCKHKQHIDFDLELARSQSNDNPVYYVQYAHARICSIFRELANRNLVYDSACGQANLALLTATTELALLRLLAAYPETIITSAQLYEPYLLSNYLRNLAACFHTYYNTHHLLVDNQLLMQARLVLANATRQVLNNGLNLLGITAQENM
jgi:arginyl-tRNA synthetase